MHVKEERTAGEILNTMEILKNIPVEFNTNALLSSVHIKPGSSHARDITHVIETIRPKINPKAVYRMSYIQVKLENAVDIDGVRFTSRVLRVNFDKAERVFPFIATCGTEVEELSQQYDDVLDRYVLDSLKEQVLRRAVMYLRKHIQTTYLPGKISMMNPGSLEDWPLTEQKQLFSLFGDVKSIIGVELTESFLMVPVKSVSGIIFPTEVTFENCQLCPRENCPGRRAPYNETLWKTMK
jgi:hypothetical protein